MNTPLSRRHAWLTSDAGRGKDHTTEVGPISVLSYGGREFNSGTRGGVEGGREGGREGGEEGGR